MAGDRAIKVTLRADVQDFKSQFDQAAQAAERAKQAANDAARDSLSGWGKVKQSAQDNRQAWTTAGTALTGFGAAVLGVGAMAARTGVAYNQLQQRAGSALEVLMGSAEAAAAQMAKLNEFADTSPFSREIFIEAQQQLIAFGVEAERVVPILSAVQDAVAATGGSNADIAELVNIIAKVGSTGKITAQTLNELGYRGVDAATIIGEQMGKTGQQIRDEITAGTLDADAAMQALTDGMTERFGGAAAGMKETFDGALDRVRAAWRDLSAELTAPLVSPDGGGILVDLTNSLADAMRDFQALPGPVKATAAALAGLTGAASLGAGAFLLLLPRALDTIDAFKTLAEVNPRLANGLGKVGKAAGVAAAAFAVLGAAGKLADQFSDDVVAADVLESKLANLAETGDVTVEALDEIAAMSGSGGASVKDFGYALDSVNMNGFMKGLDFVGSAFGIFDSDVSLGMETLASFDAAMTGFAKSGAWDDLHASFAAAVESSAEYGLTAEDIIAASPMLEAALTDAATAMGLPADMATLVALAMEKVPPAAAGAADGMEGVEGAAEDVESAVEKATGAVNDHITALTDVGNAFLSARDAARKYEESLEDAYDLLDEYDGVTHWDDGTEAARRFEEAIDDVASAYLTEVETARANGDATAEIMQSRREDILALGKAYDIPKEELNSYLEMIGLAPEEIQQRVDLETDEAREKWDEIYQEMFPEGGHPPMSIDADTDPAKESVTEFEGVITNGDPADIPVGADTSAAEDEVHVFGSQIGDVPTEPIIVDADTFYGEQALRMLIAAVNDSGGTVEINGETMTADQALAALVSMVNESEGVVNINGVPTDAESALIQLVSHINGSEGTVTIEGNNDPAFRSTDAAKRHADGTTGTIDVNANTSSASSAIDTAARTRYSTIQVTWRQTNSRPSVRQTSNIATFATGGAVHGPGTGTSDSIPAMLSNNEHVFTAREVGVAGGHQAIYSLRQQLLAGAKTLHLATGGGVENGSVAPVRYTPVAQQMQAQSLSASVDSGAIALAVREGMQSATVIAQVSDRVAANLYQRGASASRAYGGAK